MSDLLEYKDYKGTVEFDSDDEILHGRVLFINSLLIYHGESIYELKLSFQNTINDYLAHCKRANVDPNKPFNGSFNVRVGTERHQKLATMAIKNNLSMNELICNAVDKLLKQSSVQNHMHLHIERMELIATEPVTASTSNPQDWQTVLTTKGVQLNAERAH